jgi:hypothetical protein
VDAAELKIGNEVHRLCGLIRFSVVTGAEDPCAPGRGDSPLVPPPPEAGRGDSPLVPPPPEAGRGDSPLVSPLPAREILYARVAPDHEVLEFIAPHFADRFKCDPFIIHDTKRGRAVVAWQKRWYIVDFTEKDATLLRDTAGEMTYQDLWRSYFDALAIRERKNSRCQRNLMPARYWQDLPEMQPR